MENGFRNQLLVWIFLIFIAVISLLSILLPQKAFSSSENRYLQKKPEISGGTLLDGTFGKKYEQYLSDQFPGRNGWVGVKVGTERLVGKTAVNGVYFGKENYLIEQFEEEDLRGEQLENNLDSLVDFTKFAVKMYGGDHTRVMLVPSASQVMREHLPLLAAPYDQNRITEEFWQKINDSLEGEGAEEKPAVVGAKSKSPAQIIVPVEGAMTQEMETALYYRTDHHWTAKGAYRAYAAWSQSIGLKPWTESEFNIQRVSGSFHGTVYSKVNVPWIYDSIELYLPKAAQEFEVVYDQDGKIHDTLYSMKALEGKDQYSVYLDGNHGLTEIVNKSEKVELKDRRLLIIKDSYAHSFAPFAANQFGSVTMVDLRYMNVDLRSWMKEQQFTDVLVLYQIPGFARDKNVIKLEE